MPHAYPRASIWLGTLVAGIAVGCASGANSSGAAGTTGTAGTTGSAGATGGGGTTDPYAGFAAKALHVSGNKIVDTTGATVRLLGVNRAGTEYMCVPPTTGSYTFDGSTGPSSIAALKTWHINTVRLPLNESCWLGLSGIKQTADQYQADVEDYVQRLHIQGIYVVLDLHWSSPTSPATFQTAMAFSAHGPDFWTSVATRFKTDPMVIFDLYNEPILDASDSHGNGPVSDPWGCWLNGCDVTSGTLAGMQSLLNAVRATGAQQIVIAGGVDWAHKLDQWLAKKPSDPTGNLIAGLHIYNDGGCNTQSCWDSTVAPVAASVPVITGELGERDCQHSFIDGFMSWADSHGVGYLGWAWNPPQTGTDATSYCKSFPSLITDASGTPSGFGQGLHDHLLQINP